jgi:hypothetical protein
MKPRPADHRSLGVLSTFAAPGRDGRTLSRATKTPPPFTFTRSLNTKKPALLGWLPLPHAQLGSSLTFAPSPRHCFTPRSIP